MAPHTPRALCHFCSTKLREQPAQMLSICYMPIIPGPRGVSTSVSRCSAPVLVKWCLWEQQLSHGDVQGLFAETSALAGLFL